jgi:hypothetical protein
MQAIQLPKSSLSTLSGHKHQWISCENGMIWLSDDGHDVILERGQKWQVHSDQPVVIEALANSSFAIKPEAYKASGLRQQISEQITDLVHHFVHKPAVKTVNI